MKFKHIILAGFLAGNCISSRVAASHLAVFRGLRESSPVKQQKKQNRKYKNIIKDVLQLELCINFFSSVTILGTDYCSGDLPSPKTQNGILYVKKGRGTQLGRSIKTDKSTAGVFYGLRASASLAKKKDRKCTMRRHFS